MAFLDTSVILDYLDGEADVVAYVDEQSHLLTSSLCVYEVLQGEALSSGQSDMVDARQTFGRVEAVPFDETIALEAARMQDGLASSGAPMPARDLMIAASARSTGATLAVTDADFQTDGLDEYVTVTNPREQ
jgi:predicted nucleic acid-binding protein